MVPVVGLHANCTTSAAVGFDRGRANNGERSENAWDVSRFGVLAVKNVPIEKWDDSGLGIEPNNLKAINSLIAV
jgi:hypothetical protein